MRAGVVDIDWMVGITVFTIFMAISTVYYVTLFPEKGSPMEDAKSFISENVFDALSVNAQEITVRYDGSPDVLSFNLNWAGGGQNSTMVLDSTGNPVDCRIVGDTLYVNSLVGGLNYFTIRYSDAEVGMRCTGTFQITGAQPVTPWASVPAKMFSEARISNMSLTPYQTFRDSLDINQNFRVWINMSGTESWYGPELSTTSGIYTAEKWYRLEETGEIIGVRVYMW